MHIFQPQTSGVTTEYSPKKVYFGGQIEVIKCHFTAETKFPRRLSYYLSNLKTPIFPLIKMMVTWNK